jgi:RimJ/RimL family protein N-acetyltransferase
MWIRDPQPHDLFDLAENMRADDAREIFLMKRDKDRQQFAIRIWRMMPRAVHACVFGLDTEPRAIGFLGLWAKDETGGLCEAALWARDPFALVAPRFVRHVRQRLMPFLMDNGIRRVECRTLETYTASRRLLAAMGARQETLLPDFGPDGEAFVQFAWRVSDWRPSPDVLRGNTERADRRS